MATDTKMEAGFLEKLGDAFNNISEGLMGFLSRLFGSSNERHIRAMGYLRSRGDEAHTIVPGSLLYQVNALEEQLQGLSDDELKELTPGWRERLAAGETLDDLLPEVFAATREAARRTKNMRHFDVQILGGIVLHRGNIAEMVTGEGKTLVATLPAVLNALSGDGVHIVTVNDYLARRDAEWMSPIYHALGISCGFIQSDMSAEDRRKAYNCDITYGTNSEFGFDYLRDNMKPARWGDGNYAPESQQVQRMLNYAIIDEVDNILIDEARTPLIISGPAFGDLKRYARANDIVLQLNELQKQHPERYFEVKEKERTVHLTDEGVRKAEELAGVESFYTAGNDWWPHLIDNALKAHHLYHKDKEYVVMRHPETGDLSIIIVDEFTGRLMIGRQWSDGLHQAVEAKHAREGVKIKEETQTLATVTLQNFFKLYKKLAGMTGTAMTEANEFWKIYELDVIAIPTNKPLVRTDYADKVYLTEKAKWAAVVEELERMHKWDVLTLKDGTQVVGIIKNEGEENFEVETRDTHEKKVIPIDDIEDVDYRQRPILIGTVDVDKSEKLSGMLKRRGVKHELLNAKPEYAAREAEIIAQAGRIGAVTISTNMAGRGTDIILGGNPEFLAWARLKDQYATRLDVPPEVWKKTVEEIEAKEKMKEEGRRVAEMGGMHILGTERHEARRIDNQLRGRSGRQGDPGTTRFYLSLEDELMRIFAGDWVKGVLQRLGMEENESIENRMVSRRIEGAQKKVEERNFDIRKHLLEYDEVMDIQRKRVYGFRQEILEGANCKIRVLDMIRDQIDKAVERFMEPNYGASCFADFASKRLAVELDARDFGRLNIEEADRYARDRATKNIPTTIQEYMDENLSDDVEAKEWNWQAMANACNRTFGLKLTERQLKQIGREHLDTFLIAEAEKSLNAVDLKDAEKFLKEDWGRRSVCDWARAKFQLKIDPNDLKELSNDQIKEQVYEQVLQMYHQKDIEFPVKLAMARFMVEGRPGPLGGGQRYDREGLMQYARQRFPEGAAVISEDTWRSSSRAKLEEILLEISKRSFPEITQDDLDGKLEEVLGGAGQLDETTAEQLAAWVKTECKLGVSAEELIGLDHAAARTILWSAYDDRYRPEMRRMERSLLLNQLDTSWKNHLYTMDHLRAGIHFVGYAQTDPKTEYKREGMREFDTMWENLEDKISDTVFRMEDDEAFQESLWAIGVARHDAAGMPTPAPDGSQQGITNTSQGDKKPEPIRRHGDKVGRNDPCPCGSGKKYKNCCMRAMA